MIFIRIIGEAILKEKFFRHHSNNLLSSSKKPIKNLFFLNDLTRFDYIRYLEELQSDGKITMMIGDGINDAPSLHQADVGVAVHNAREISIDAADVLLTQANLESITELIRL